MDNEIQYFDSAHIEKENGTSTLYLIDNQANTSMPIKLIRARSSASDTDGITVYAIDESGVEFQYRSKLPSKEEADRLMDDLLKKSNFCDHSNNSVWAGT